jgi:nitrite reductase/ring-hydroxylating ferredoxin subunit
MGRFLTRLIDAQGFWAKPFGDFNHWWLSGLFRRIWAVKDFLNGRWLGHPFHSASTDLPIGVLGLAVLFDVIGQPAAADVALGTGIVLMLLSALSGLADYTDTDGVARTRATVHATLMVLALVVYLVSLWMRLGQPADRTLPIVLSVLAWLLVLAAAFVGGDVVYALGNMVSRHAFRAAGGGGTKWVALDLGGAADIPEGELFKAKAGASNLVIVRNGSTILALHETCAHAGGPLAQGTLVDGQVECPWHGSRFRLADGRATRGPTVYDQPRYEVRRSESGAGWEARLIRD